MNSKPKADTLLRGREKRYSRLNYMVKSILIILVFLSTVPKLIAQPRQVGLGQTQREKIEKIKSAEKKLKAYKKFIHKDSLRYAKEVDQYWQKKSDSITAAVNGKFKNLSNKKTKLLNQAKDPLNRLEARVQISEDVYRFPKEIEISYTKHQQEVFYSLTRYYLTEVAKDTANLLSSMFTIPDLAGLPGFEKIKKPDLKWKGINDPSTGIKTNVNGLVQKHVGNNALVKEANELKGVTGKYLGEYKKYEQYANMSPDSLKQLGINRLEKEGQSQIVRLGAGQYEQQMKQLNEVNALQSQYKNQFTDLQDSTRRKELAKAKAEELAMDYMADNPGILDGAKKKMDLLMKKYSYVSNSNDLSTAVKRTSLEGKLFRERLVIATNFQVLNLDPVSIDFSPQVGYKFNSRFVVGLGGTYRQTFKDSIPTLSPEVFGAKVFASYDVVKSFFAYGEFNENSPGVRQAEGQYTRIWKPAALLGVGRKFSVHKKIDMTVVALYNFLHDKSNALYPRPFMVRVGFQLSDIALLKKRPELKY